MSIPSVKIVINGSNGAGSGVEIDGARIPGTHTISFRHKVGEVPTVTIELWAKEISAEIDGAHIVLTPDHIRALQDVTQVGDTFRVHEPALDIEALAGRVADLLGQRANRSMR